MYNEANGPVLDKSLEPKPSNEASSVATLSRKEKVDKLVKGYGKFLVYFGFCFTIIYVVALVVEICLSDGWRGLMSIWFFPVNIVGLIFNMYFMMRGRSLARVGISDHCFSRTSTISIIIQTLLMFYCIGWYRRIDGRKG